MLINVHAWYYMTFMFNWKSPGGKARLADIESRNRLASAEFYENINRHKEEDIPAVPPI